MGQGYVFYAVITPEGKPRRRKHDRQLMIYDSMGAAQKACREGDSVVDLVWDSDREPLFIRTKQLEE